MTRWSVIYFAFSVYAILRAFGDTSWLLSTAWAIVALTNLATAALFALGAYKPKAQADEEDRPSYEVTPRIHERSIASAHPAPREAH